MILYLSYSFFLTFSVIGFGKLTSLLDKKINLEESLYGILGLFYLSVFATFFHFFFGLSELINFAVFLSGFIIFILFKDFSIFKKKEFYLIFLFVLLLYFSHKPHEDFGYYHLPYVINFNESKIILGTGNLAEPYVWNSMWLNLMSVFNLPYTNYKIISFPSIMLLFFTLFYFLEFIQKNLIQKNLRISNLICIFLLFYLIIKFNRFSSFGVDVPSFLIISLLLLLSILTIEKNKLEISHLYLFLSLPFFLVTIKLSNLSIFIIVIIITKLYLKKNNVFYACKFLALPVLFFTIWAIQQFFYTGCFLFPSEYSCFNVSWFSKDILLIAQKLEITNKSYWTLVNRDLFSPEEYISKFNWVSNWFIANQTKFYEHILAIMIVPFILILLKQFKLRSSKINIKIIYILTIYLGISLIILQYSPLLRFGFATLFLIVFILFATLFEINHKKIKVSLLYQLILISIVFSSTKNFIRIDDFSNPYPQFVKANYLGTNTQFKNIKLNKPINKGQGWQGRLCWNTPFICTYNPEKLVVNKNNLNYLVISKK